MKEGFQCHSCFDLTEAVIPVSAGSSTGGSAMPMLMPMPMPFIGRAWE
jgi:hypothetical protein